MSRYSDLVNPAATPQTEPLDERQVENNAGGFTYSLDKWKLLERFLVLGSDTPTYYQKARDLTKANSAVVIDCANEDPERTVRLIETISVEGRAPKNDPAIFALALIVTKGSEIARQMAYSAMPRVCRTGTHLFQFVEMARALGKGFGRGMKRAVAGWYNSKSVDDLAYQVVKYRQREGYTHERLLDLSHPKGDGSPEREVVYQWIVGKTMLSDLSALPRMVRAHEEAMHAASAVDCAHVISREPRLPWEALPTEHLTSPEVLKALLPSMPLMALMRNLANLTRHGVLKPLSHELQLVYAALGSEEYIRRSRLHPFAILQALTTYASGRGFRGTNTWTPIQSVVDALNEAFYKAFANVRPSGQRIMLALDISGSMDGSLLFNSNIDARMGSAAMALVTAATERQIFMVGFHHASGGISTGQGRWMRSHGLSDGIAPIEISPSMRLDQVVRYTQSLQMGGTDCSLPMLYALQQGLSVDAFVVYTDNETWAGRMHPAQALKEYRARTGIAAKLIVVGMTATEFSIADPADAGMLDVVGFDSAAPAVISNFIGESAEATIDSSTHEEFVVGEEE